MIITSPNGKIINFENFAEIYIYDNPELLGGE